MSSLVIVAIPEEDDLVWKVSSEKKPHLTLMYLGETNEVNHAGRMAEFVQHALNVNEHGSFYLDVDHRGELGPDKADVLFFRNGWDSKWIKSLRGQLLQQNDIRTAFDAADTFPEWVPHLTLGYPTSPANPVPDDLKLYSVCFDRVAVWVGDYEGPEFRLKWPEREYDDNEPSVAYSDMGESAISDILSHHGVKGMKWGQRKEDSSVIERPKNNLTKNQKIGVAAAIGGGALATAPVSWAAGGILGFGVANLHKGTRENLKKNRDQDKDFRNDKKWEKEFKKDKRYADVHNDTADHMNAWLPSYNKKYDGVDLTKNPAKMKEYEDGYFKEHSDSFAKSYSKIYGSSPSGKYKVSVIPGTDKVVLHNTKVDPGEFKHAAEQEEPLMTFRVTQDKDTWHIIKVEPVADSITQSAMGEEFVLEHVGIKGMRWGHRKAEPVAVMPSSTSRVPHGTKRKTKIEVEGGENHPATEDAKKAAEARVKLHKSGPAALSNKELQELANRLRLEQQVKELGRSDAHKFVREFVTGQGKQTLNVATGSRIQNKVRAKPA